jgi:AbiJ-like protein
VSSRFSERIGSAQVAIQIGTMDSRLRSTIWNFVHKVLPDRQDRRTPHYEAIDSIAENVLRVPMQHVDRQAPVHWLLAEVQKMSWAEVYDLLEYVVEQSDSWNADLHVYDVQNYVNELLEREHSGYRFVNGELAPIVSPAQISEIEIAS